MIEMIYRRGTQRTQRDCFRINNYSFDWNEVTLEGREVHRKLDTWVPPLCVSLRFEFSSNKTRWCKTSGSTYENEDLFSW